MCRLESRLAEFPFRTRVWPLTAAVIDRRHVYMEYMHNQQAILCRVHHWTWDWT